MKGVRKKVMRRKGVNGCGEREKKKRKKEERSKVSEERKLKKGQ